MTPTSTYLHTVFGDLEGVAHIAVGSGGHHTETGRYEFTTWAPSTFAWPNEADALERAIMQAAAAGDDVYCCPYLMHGSKRAQGAAVARRLVHADIDHGHLDLERVRELGGFAVGSGSPGNGHVYVAVDRPLTAVEHTSLCRSLGAWLGGADAKLTDNDVLRPPGTVNGKHEPAAAVSWLVEPTGAVWEPEALADRLGAVLTAPTAPAGATGAAEPYDLSQAPPRLLDALAHDSGDRSADTMRVLGAAHDAGLTLGQARMVVNGREDLAERLAERDDDDVLTCWLKVTDERVQRAAERRRESEWVAELVGSGDKGLSPEPATDRETGAGEVQDAAAPLDVITASAVTLSRVRYLWDGRIPIGAPTLMPGEEGIGKTTVGARVMADLTRGRLPGEFYGTAKDVIVMATEDGLEDVFVPRLQEAGADLERVHIVRARVGLDGDKHTVIIPRDLEHIGRLVREHDVALVWVDSLVTTLPDELKSISYKDTAKVLRRLGEWASSEKVAVVAPWHLNKATGSDTAVRIMDSRAFRTAVRSMLLVVPDPDAPEGITRGIVALDKANAGTLDVPGLRYELRSAAYEVDEVDEQTGEVRTVTATCGVADWIGEVDGDGRQIARDALAPKIEKDGGPRQWLREYLEDEGEALRLTVLAEAFKEGFSESSIKRAARHLRVHSVEETGQVDGRPYKRSVWSLPSGVGSGSQSVHTHPTGPTDPTGEGSSDPTTTTEAGITQSGQWGQSGLSRESDPTGQEGDPTGEDPRTCAYPRCGNPPSTSLGRGRWCLRHAAEGNLEDEGDSE